MPLIPYYIGTQGPYYFDTDKDMPRQKGVPQVAFRTPGPIIVENTPTESTHVARLADVSDAIKAVEVVDINDPVELTLETRTENGALIIAYQDGDPNIYTLYVWDAFLTGGTSPQIIYIPSSNGGWIGIAGENSIYRNEFFWEEGGNVGFKLKRNGVWTYFYPNSTNNGLAIYKTDTE